MEKKKEERKKNIKKITLTANIGLKDVVWRLLTVEKKKINLPGGLLILNKVI